MKRFFFWNRDEPQKPADQRDRGGQGDSAGLMTGNPAEDERSLRILLESIAEVGSSLELDQVLGGIVDKSLQVTDAERALLLLGPSPDELQIKIARAREGGDLTIDQQYSTSVVRRSLTEGQPVRSVVQSDREALELGQSVFDLKLRAVMCAPLQVKDKTIGAIYVDSRGQRREFSARDLALFGALSAQLAIAVENARLLQDSLAKIRLEKDVEVLKRIQRHLLAPVPERVPGLELALQYVPVEGASGDTYDFVPLGAGRMAFLIGDVTGHGIGAALLTHAAQAAMRSYLELLDDVQQVVSRLNNRLVAGVETGNFMSLLLVIVDTKARTLHYVNAGHPGLIHVSAGGATELEKTGMVLGVVADQHYAARGPIPLAPGDLLFLRTDGVDETMNPSREIFGSERLLALLGKQRGRAAKDVLAAVHAALTAHAASQPWEDDLSMIAIRIQPA